MADRSFIVVLVVLGLSCCMALSGSLLTRRRSDWVSLFSWLTVCLAVGLAVVSRASGRTELDPWTWWLALLAVLMRGIQAASPSTLPQNDICVPAASPEELVS